METYNCEREIPYENDLYEARNTRFRIGKTDVRFFANDPSITQSDGVKRFVIGIATHDIDRTIGDTPPDILARVLKLLGIHGRFGRRR
jgi:hypothetical protein